MTTHQLVAGALGAALLAGACSRAETQQEASEAAAGVRQVAARAGDKLADSWLTTKIQAQFFADDDIKARYINVTSRDGEVTLTGSVDSEEVRQQALQIARNTDGVRQLNDRLTVGGAATQGFEPPPSASTSGAVATGGTGAPPTDDAAVTSAIQAKYYLDPAIKMRRVDVQARGGVVTLRGEVGSEHERGQALLLARSTEGVQRVEDHLTVNAAAPQTGTPQPGAAQSPMPASPVAGAAGPGAATAPAAGGDAAIQSRLQAALAADAQTNVAGIEVSSKDGVALLQGVAPSAAAKERALTIARQTQGVVQVVDRISVAQRR